MKIVHKSIQKDGEGKLGIIPEEPDDLWFIYNLIQKGDQITASTMRKVVNESSTGSTGSHRVKITLTISAEKIDYDTEGDIIKVKGKNILENKHVKRGQYHTLDLELNKRFFVVKPVWDSMALRQLDNACDKSKHSDLAVVIMQEGLAFVCYITKSMTVQKAKIEVNIPRKRKNMCSQYQKSLTGFFEQISQAILKHINFQIVKCVVVASPGFTKDQFLQYFWQQANKSENRILLENRQKFLSAHSSTGFKHSIREILSDPLIQPKLEDTKCVEEVRVWNKFQELLANDPDRAVYGMHDVEFAHRYEAVETMIISDKLFRSTDLVMRRKYNKLIQDVIASGSQVHIFSSLHPCGEQLAQLTGLAAILKFIVPDLIHINDESDTDTTSTSNTESSDGSTRSSNLGEEVLTDHDGEDL